MNTPAHMMVNAVLLGRRRTPGEAVAAVLGGLLPDLPMMGFYCYEKMWLHHSEVTIWQDYNTPGWQALFDTFHSLPFLCLLAVAAWWRGSGVGVCLGLSMVLHSLEDLPLHHHDAHRHLFPFSDWRFLSPISYWDPQYYGQIVGPLELGIVLVCGGHIFRSHPWRGTKIMAGAIMASYLVFWVYAVTVWGAGPS